MATAVRKVYGTRTERDAVAVIRDFVRLGDSLRPTGFDLDALGRLLPDVEVEPVSAASKIFKWAQLFDRTLTEYATILDGINATGLDLTERDLEDLRASIDNVLEGLRAWVTSS